MTQLNAEEKKRRKKSLVGSTPGIKKEKYKKYVLLDFLNLPWIKEAMKYES